MKERENPLRRLNAAGQSVWCDYLTRTMLRSGELERLVEQDDLRGVTTNPTIFDKAISGGAAYDEQIRRECETAGASDPRSLFFSLAVEDIREAARQLRPVFERTGGVDGRVSLEVSPDLAYDTEGTVEEALTLYQRVAARNVMIKVPATRQGLPAISRLVAEGISVNATLLFSRERYDEVVDAYLRGLEKRAEAGEPVDEIASVASFFVSRLDSALDPVLEKRRPEWVGGAAVANARLAYQRFLSHISDTRFRRLRELGARPQRLLWASTGTKNPAYSDVLYVESLCGPDTVNTMPPATYEAFRDHGNVDPEALTRGVEQAQELLEGLAELEIDLAEVTEQLERDGVAAFRQSFDNLLSHLGEKMVA
ncbi:MAG: transaldolase [Ectothiorhodospiraceae bacterium]|jgi:transaldolase